MAFRPANILLRRRPTGPALPRVPARVQRFGGAPKTSSFPLLPATAAALLLLGAAQLGFWWWESRLPGMTASRETRSNPFMALAKVSSPEPRKGKSSLKDAQRLVAPTLPQNLQFGDAMARVTVTIFTDPSCGACREQVRDWTAGLPIEGVRQVYKFWPQDPDRLTPGMLLELARRQSAVPNFWRSLQGAGSTDLDDGRLLDMLDRAGVPLAEQRAALVNEGPSLMASLEEDIQLAKNAGLPRGPVIVVDDYVLDGEVLSPDSLRIYVQRRLDGREILERGNLWLMRK